MEACGRFLEFGSSERIRIAASRQKDQKQEVMPSEKEPGFPGFFFLGLLPGATVYHLFLAQNWNVFFETILNESERSQRA
jgi:hypothetical protein